MAKTCLKVTSPVGACRRVTLVVLLFVLAGSAAADGLRVTPIIQALPHDRTMAMYRVSNVNNRPLTVQIEAHRWHQHDGKRVLSQAAELLVVPPLVTLDPGQTQLVRIAYRGGTVDQELDYRVRFEEVAARYIGTGVGIGTTVTLDVPLFFLDRKPVVEANWELGMHGGQGRLSLTNKGSRYLRFSGLTVTNSAGDSIQVGQTPQYLLAGNTLTFRLPWPVSSLRKGVVVHYQQRGRLRSRAVSFE